MIEIDTFQLVIEAAILLLLLYLAFFKSYFQEKGKNLATKEDVKEITSTVESVKSQLEFSLQAKLSLRAEEHEALVGYFSKYHAWISAINNCSFAEIDYRNARRLAEIRNQLDALQLEFELAAGKMELLVENTDITLQHGKLTIETIKFHAHAEQTSYTFQKQYLEAKQMKLNTPQNEQLERYQALSKKKTELYRKFKKEQLEMYRTLFPLIKKQRSAISDHLKKLVDG